MSKKGCQSVKQTVLFAGGDGVGSFAQAIYQMMALKEMEKKNANKSVPVAPCVVPGGVVRQQVNHREVM